MATKGDKVYLVTIECAIDLSSSVENRAFSKLKDAKECLHKSYKNDLEDWESSFEKGHLYHELAKDKMSAEISEVGDYTRNHIAYQIESLTIE